MMMQARFEGDIEGAMGAIAGGIGGQGDVTPLGDGRAVAQGGEGGEERMAFAILRGDGVIELCTREARAWIDREPVREAIIRGLGVLADKGRARCLIRVGALEVRLARLEGLAGVRYMAALCDGGGEVCADLLTPTQREVASYAVAGATVPEIAKHLGRSPETVRSHLREIYRRLDVSNRVELAQALARRGMMDAPARTPVKLAD